MLSTAAEAVAPAALTIRVADEVVLAESPE
jgi:hypothetical protein